MKEMVDQGVFFLFFLLLLLVISVYKTNQTIWNVQMWTILQWSYQTCP